MIWHIFKKDVRLLWWMALAAAGLHFWVSVGLVRESRDFAVWHSAFAPVDPVAYSLLAAIVLAVLILHQDPLAGAWQDWLTRPISRRDLALAKMFAVIALVQLPMFAATLAVQLAVGYSTPEALWLACVRSLWFSLSIALPALAVASITRNLMEALAAGVLYLLLIAWEQAVLRVPSVLRLGDSHWVADAGFVVVLALVSAGVLWLQFARRRTWLARGIAFVGAVCAFLTDTTPWNAAYAVERWTDKNPSAAANVTMTPDIKHAWAARDFPGRLAFGLQLSVRGLPPENGRAMLNIDRADVFVKGVAGAEAVNRLIRSDAGARAWANGPVSQTLFLDPKAYKQVAHTPLDIEIEDYLSLYERSGQFRVPADTGMEVRQVGDAAWCRSSDRVPGDEGKQREVWLDCRGPAFEPPCVALRMGLGEARPYTDCGSRQVRFETPTFPGVFSPRLYVPDSFHVDSVTLDQYRKIAHFKRRIELRGIRLADLVSE